MEIKSQYESPLVLENIEIIESTFRKKQGSLNEIQLGIKIDREVNTVEDNRYEILLNTTVSDEDESLFVQVKSRALFYTKSEYKKLIERNTIAIMFPYIRSYISIITTQPGMTPIVLPAMNIAALVEEQK